MFQGSGEGVSTAATKTHAHPGEEERQRGDLKDQDHPNQRPDVELEHVLDSRLEPDAC
jgi:hypothetical protein